MNSRPKRKRSARAATPSNSSQSSSSSSSYSSSSSSSREPPVSVSLASSSPSLALRSRSKNPKRQRRIAPKLDAKLKQFEPITNEQEALLQAELDAWDPSLGPQEGSNATVLAKTVYPHDPVLYPNNGLDKIEITRSDIYSLLEGKDGIQGDITNKVITIICNHVNEYHGRNTPDVAPYCATVEKYDFVFNMRRGNFNSPSRELTRRGMPKEKFEQVKHLFISIEYSFPSEHQAVLVISPKAKTIDYLDSWYRGARKDNSNTAITWACKLLGKHLGRSFIHTEWKARTNGSPVQRNSADSDCGVYTLMNVMCLAFGYDLDKLKKDEFPPGKNNDDQVFAKMSRKKRRTTAELLHGKFDKFPKHPKRGVSAYAYEFGDYDDTIAGAGFSDIPEEVINALPEKTRLNVGKYKNVTTKAELLRAYSNLPRYIASNRHTFEECLYKIEQADEFMRRLGD